MAGEINSFQGGFAIGFIFSLLLCFVYMGILAAEQKRPTVVPVETYKFKAPIVTGEPPTSQILKYGVPDRGPPTLNYKNHVVGYDQARKIPTWVAEFITKEHIQGDSDRDKCSFKPDRDKVDGMFSSTLDDYSKSGYDRGHMSPAANHKYSQDAMCDSFFLTSVVPQNSQHNRRYWRDVQGYCRDLATRYEEVRVVTGTLFLPDTAERATQGSRFVKYEVIGQSNVTVPTHLFKIIVVENATDGATNTTLFTASFLLPNEKVDPSVPLITFKVSLERLESAAGLRFLPRLAGAPLGDLCSVDPCQLRGELEARVVGTVGRLSGGALLIVVVTVWVFLMFKWREEVEKSNKK